jgi:NAD(P)-dependent dehydrogenase (short-subunit alcohol dehydrogenase family)
MTIADRAVLATGADRGIGQALVEEALRRGAKRVYAGTRQPLAPLGWARHALTLDVTQRDADSGSCRESRVSRYPHQ